jgi:threonine synthase
MDIQIASNFERLIYDLNNGDDTQTISAMNDIKEKGKYIIDQERLDRINSDFLSSKMNEDEVLKTIKEVYEKFDLVLDPHSAIGYGAFNKINISGNNIVLATAHPCKFPDAIKRSININAKLPNELSFIMEEKEDYDIIENNLEKIKQHIKERIL